MGIDSGEVFRLAADLAAAPVKVTSRAPAKVTESAHATQRDAQRFAPVLTGTLRESIVVESHGMSADVVATARYADYVEYGTSDTAPQPFMRPAAGLAGSDLADGLGDLGEDIL